MSAQDPIGSSATAERPTNPTHFGGDGLYEAQSESSGRPDGEDASANAPRSQQRSADAFWEFARRRHVPAVLAVGGLVWLLVALVRRSTERW
ncbi:MAG TPA: hypothetical protein VFO35_18195 [Steroidobacteraceae bacterium]|nr:hypothetical protein [Steroidobacteraceae bacterium]